MKCTTGALPGSAIDVIGAGLEGFGEFVEGRIENPADEQREGAIAKLIGDVEFDAAGAWAELDESPLVLEMLERSVDIFDEDFEFRRIERHPAREGLADRLVTDFHIGQEHPPSIAKLARFPKPQVAAERHEFGIGADIRDEGEHLGGGMLDTAFGAKSRHRRYVRQLAFISMQGMFLRLTAPLSLGGTRRLEPGKILTGVMR